MNLMLLAKNALQGHGHAMPLIKFQPKRIHLFVWNVVDAAVYDVRVAKHFSYRNAFADSCSLVHSLWNCENGFTSMQFTTQLKLG